MALSMLVKQQSNERLCGVEYVTKNNKAMSGCVALGMLVKQQSNVRLCGVGYVSKTTKQCAFVWRWVCY